MMNYPGEMTNITCILLVAVSYQVLQCQLVFLREDEPVHQAYGQEQEGVHQQVLPQQLPDR